MNEIRKACNTEGNHERGAVQAKKKHEWEGEAKHTKETQSSRLQEIWKSKRGAKEEEQSRMCTREKACVRRKAKERET